MPARAARPFRSRAKTWRGRWPLSEADGNSQGLARQPALGRALVHPGAHGGAGLSRQRDHALLGALAAHGEETIVAPRHGGRQADQLRDAQAGGVEHLDQRMQPPRGEAPGAGERRIGGLRGGAVEQAAGLGLAHDPGQRPPAARRLDGAGRVVGAQALGVEELEELAQRRELAGLRGGGEAARGDIGDIGADIGGRGAGEPARPVDRFSAASSRSRR
jgi:hypothetical protein